MRWRRKWQPTPVLLPGKFRGLRSLAGYSPWGRKESDTTERLHFTSLLLVVKKKPTLLANTGEVRDTGVISGLGRSPEGGPDNLLQYSCLANPMDGGAW